MIKNLIALRFWRADNISVKDPLCQNPIAFHYITFPSCKIFSNKEA
jgi:hypothetical protein